MSSPPVTSGKAGSPATASVSSSPATHHSPPVTQPPRLAKPLRITEQSWPEGTVPVVSVFCWTYNDVNYIRDAIEGFFMQETTFPVEIIIHDDASTDGTADIIRDYESKYPQLFRNILHSENQMSQGRSVMEPLFSMPRGEFISLTHGDDYWTSKTKLQLQVELLDGNSSVSLVFHNAHIRNTRVSPEISYIMHEALEKDVFQTEDLLRQWFIPTTSIMFRNYKSFHFPECFLNCQSGDIPLLLLLSLRGSLKYINESMSVYRLHPQGISTSHNGESKVAGMIYIYQAFNQYTNRVYESKVNEAILTEIHAHLPELQRARSRLAALEWEHTRPLWRRILSFAKRRALSVVR